MTQAVSGLGSAGGGLESTTNKDLAALTSEDFLKMLITQLTHQDPTDPMDNREILDQMGTIQSLESNTRLVGAIEDLTLQSRIGAGAGLIGRDVVALSDAGVPVRGLVSSILVGEDDVALALSNGSGTEMYVSLSNVLEIREGTVDDGSDQAA